MQAVRRLPIAQPAEPDARFGKSLLWPAAVYASEPKLAHLSRQLDRGAVAFLEREASCFEGSTLVDADGWRALFDLQEDEGYRLQSLASEHPLARAQAQAEEILAEAWPEAAREYESMIKGVAWFESANRKNFSDPKAFGMIFFNVGNGSDPYRLVEELVHECAHHALFIETSTDQLLVNPKQEAFSPIRNQMRPAIGVYHGSFAMGRMVELARRLRGLGGAAASLAATRMLEDHLVKQRLAVNELKKVELTPKGALCLAEMEAHAIGD